MYGRASEMKLSPTTLLPGLCGRCGFKFVGVSLFMAHKEKLLILAGTCLLKLPLSWSIFCVFCMEACVCGGVRGE